ncbi:uncharacterized protein LOC128951566 [Oppia nitens]|uniref:uncharacterized protein LOC128951566 n=1 Tax=Oppia nitens TaxID=1686743 RepID=UPI0023DB00ED|nr:uncharacterized protein LOC128951566 [Oppia nitens]
MTTNEDLPKFKDVIDNNNTNTDNVVKLVVIFDGQHNHHLTYDQLLIDGQSLLLLLLAAAAARVPYFDVDPDNDPFLYIHTSGSTGSPKCVKLKHQSILILMHERGHFLDPDIVSSPGALKKHCIAFPYPFGHISGSAILPLQLCMGYPLVIYSQFDDHLLFQSVETYRITFLGTFPSFGRRLVDPDVFSRYDMSSLQIVNTGGAAFPGNIARDIIDKYNVIFREGYGMTEYLFITAGRNIADEFKSGNCGPVSPGTECKVADLATGQPLGPNSDGELCVRGLKLFAGYVNNDRAFGEAFDSDGWYMTGDIGHYDLSGNIYITDRLKEIIRVADGNLYVNVSPVEIEQFLLTHPSIAEAAVVDVNNRSGSQWPRAYVKLNSGQTTVVSDIDIKKFVADTLAYTKQLKGGVQFVDNIKRINIGKVDRKFYRNMKRIKLMQKLLLKDIQLKSKQGFRIKCGRLVWPFNKLTDAIVKSQEPVVKEIVQKELANYMGKAIHNMKFEDLFK